MFFPSAPCAQRQPNPEPRRPVKKTRIAPDDLEQGTGKKNQIPIRHEPPARFLPTFICPPSPRSAQNKSGAPTRESGDPRRVAPIALVFPVYDSSAGPRKKKTTNYRNTQSKQPNRSLAGGHPRRRPLWLGVLHGVPPRFFLASPRVVVEREHPSSGNAPL